MYDIVIKLENISKQYRLGVVGTNTLVGDFSRWWAKLRGKEDPTLKIGSANILNSVDGEYVWALKDINLQVKQGEVLGIIGKNGAGKSTLLKLLSRVTGPTTGQIKVKGRVASLLEVGTGFHGELTGRENIYLNGAILGMSKIEINNKFDEIVDFSGVEKYIDTPVKRYSSGMYVRLAFAVAAHLDPEILVVDEVLAVGDAEFQKKAIGKMQDVSKADGRTVLFVSHNMGSIKELCTRCMLLNKGINAQIGDTNEIVKKYLEKPIQIKSEFDLLHDQKVRRGHGEARYTDIVINKGDLYINPRQEIKIDCKVKILHNVNCIYAYLEIRGSEFSQPITNTGFFCLSDNPLNKGDMISFSIIIPANILRTGLYPLYFWLGKPKEIIGDNYPYDVVDSINYLNLSSDEPEKILGYNASDPEGYFNIKNEFANIKIGTDALI